MTDKLILRTEKREIELDLHSQSHHYNQIFHCPVDEAELVRAVLCAYPEFESLVHLSDEQIYQSRADLEKEYRLMGERYKRGQELLTMLENDLKTIRAIMCPPLTEEEPA